MDRPRGGAAALCLQNGVTPRELDGKLVREAMIRQGVELNKMPDGYWADVRNKIKQTFKEGGRVRVLPGGFVEFVKPEEESKS
ncbi:MAG: FAD-dependent oxidoreductase [Actinomycetia bacterium]|nr:FAD-dependent oxidoreductase [Actinomycetes bacterium]